MSLTFLNEALENSDQFILIAKDSATSSGVIVGLSRDAVEKFGLETAKRAAATKYSAGLVEPDGSVFVRSSDVDADRT
jgi:hypothetical protein